MQRREVVWIAGILIVSLAALLAGIYRGGVRYPQPNAFGPGWDCSTQPYTDVCVKYVPAAPK
jgi:hypothetical protein